VVSVANVRRPEIDPSQAKPIGRLCSDDDYVVLVDSGKAVGLYRDCGRTNVRRDFFGCDAVAGTSASS
jgi:hypothetical protein